MKDFVTYCDIYYCEECPRYCDDCNGKIENMENPEVGEEE